MNHYSIQAAANLSGISDACIRVWEKRYNCITPLRNESNHRLYSDEDIERLTLFSKLTSIGMKISQLSMLGTEELKKIYSSVSKESFKLNGLHSKKSKETFHQSIYIIEESFNAKRFDVAFHEIKKVIELYDSKEIALEFIPALEVICQNWKNKLAIDINQINAFEKILKNLVNQRTHRERKNFRNIKMISFNLESDKSSTIGSAIDMLLASHQVDNYLFDNESSIHFILALIKTISPKYIFLMASHKNSESVKILEEITRNTTAQIIIFDQNLPTLKNKKDKTENIKLFSSLNEVDHFLEYSLPI